MARHYADDELLEDIERGMLRFRVARERAEEIIRDYGWTEADEDFEFQIEQEAKKQWCEIYELDMRLKELSEDDDETTWE